MGKHLYVETPQGSDGLVKHLPLGVYFYTDGRNPKYFKIYTRGNRVLVQEITQATWLKL
jgi:hypothetical protein